MNNLGSFKLSPKEWDITDFMNVLNYLNVRNILRIDSAWSPVPTYVIQRLSDGEIVEDCGKGLTPLDAFFSALFESIERSSAESISKREFLTGSFGELKHKYNLCAPKEFFPKKQVTNDIVLKWCKGYELLSEEDIYVPLDTVAFPYDSKYFQVITTGLAANRTKEEAILHALYELIEHDTVSIYYYTGLPGRDIELTRKDEPLYNIYQKFVNVGIKIAVKYLDNDLHIPTVLTLFEEIPGVPSVKTAGIGCHFDPFIAARRALTECAQSASFWLHRYLNGQIAEGKIFHPPLYFGSHYSVNCNPIRLQEIENRSTGDVNIDLKLLLDLLKEVASRIIYVDLTREDFPFPCARLLIPNFEDLLIGDETVTKTKERAEIARKAVDEYIKNISLEEGV